MRNLDKETEECLIDLREQGLTIRKIATETGVSKSRVGEVLKGIPREKHAKEVYRKESRENYHSPTEYIPGPHSISPFYSSNFLKWLQLKNNIKTKKKLQPQQDDFLSPIKKAYLDAYKIKIFRQILFDENNR